MLRANALTMDDHCVHHLLAPAFVAGFYKATNSRMAKAYGLVVFIAVIGIVVAQMKAPWRQIVDAGVVINLAAGTLCLLGFSATTFLQGSPPRKLGCCDFRASDPHFSARNTACAGSGGEASGARALVA